MRRGKNASGIIPLWLPKAEEYNYWERSISRTLISRCGSQPCHPGCASHRRPGTISLLIRTCTEGALQGGEGPNRANRLLPVAAQKGVHCENRSVLFAQLSSFGSSTRPRSHFPKYKGQQASKDVKGQEVMSACLIQGKSDIHHPHVNPSSHLGCRSGRAHV